MKTTLLLFATIFAMSIKTQSQDLSSHQWNDRLVLILTDDTNNNTFQNQIDELYSDKQGLKDRKLVIYTVLRNQFKRDDMTNRGWVLSDDLYSKYKESEESIEILLIGLDGGVKLRQSEFLSNEELFGRIDQMPMRRNEIQRRENGK